MPGYLRNVVILVAAFAVSTAALSALGSHTSATPEQTIETFLHAAATGDGAKACAQLSAAAKRDVVATGSCVDGISAGASAYSSVIAQLKIADLATKGDTARATSTLSGQPTATFTLNRSGGKWLIVSEQRVQAAASVGSGSAGPSESRVESAAACLDKTFGVVDNAGLDSTGGVSHVVLSVDIGGYSAAEIDVFGSALAAVSGYQEIERYERPLTTRLVGSSVIVYLRTLPVSEQTNIEACG